MYFILLPFARPLAMGKSTLKEKTIVQIGKNIFARTPFAGKNYISLPHMGVDG